MSGPPRLLWITDRRRCPSPLPDQARRLVAAGVQAVQLRENDLPDAELLTLARHLREALGEGGGRLLVNDRIDVALAAGADGVHLKSDGLSPREARAAVARAAGEAAAASFLVGRSCHEAAGLVAAACEGADYVALSPWGQSPGKTALGPKGFREALERARRLLAPRPLPAWLALGGIGPAELPAIAASARPGERFGVAAVRALQGASAEAVARELAGGLGLAS